LLLSLSIAPTPVVVGGSAAGPPAPSVFTVPRAGEAAEDWQTLVVAMAGTVVVAPLPAGRSCAGAGAATPVPVPAGGVVTGVVPPAGAATSTQIQAAGQSASTVQVVALGWQ
jgi:hypothetical protein